MTTIYTVLGRETTRQLRYFTLIAIREDRSKRREKLTLEGEIFLQMFCSDFLNKVLMHMVLIVDVELLNCLRGADKTGIP